MADFSASKGLKSHISAIHEKKKPYKCEICHKAFFEKGILIKHKSAVQVHMHLGHSNGI